jgi:hypothetical protein
VKNDPPFFKEKLVD